MDDETEVPPPLTRWQQWRLRLGRGLQRVRTAIRRAAPFAAGVLAAFFGLLLYNTIFPPPRPMTAQEINDTVGNVMASATPPPPNAALVYQAIQPSLILVQAQLNNSSGKTENNLGSGVIIDDQGDIMTALHVIANASEIKVTFADGTESTAQMTSSQPDNDIAVLKADNPPAQIFPATLGNLRSMRVGDEAYAVGNPFGLYGSMSSGVISGFDRTFQAKDGPKLTGLIQFDTAVNPGNSGGPLLNRGGQVIGIVTGIINPTGQDVFIGIGFAVPINVAGGGMGSPPD